MRDAPCAACTTGLGRRRSSRQKRTLELLHEQQSALRHVARHLAAALRLILALHTRAARATS